MAARFNFSTRDLLWSITLVAVLLGWYMHHRHLQEQARMDIQVVKQLWSKERRDLDHLFQNATSDRVRTLILENENKSLKEQVEQLKKRVNQ